uniref:Uncharacterized protein n=1 Tax=Knipowitschia caucasica TaxID=637954 RepID=A0AAV2KWY1_KNICA
MTAPSGCPPQSKKTATISKSTNQTRNNMLPGVTGAGEPKAQRRGMLTRPTQPNPSSPDPAPLKQYGTVPWHPCLHPPTRPNPAPQNPDQHRVDKPTPHYP